MIDLDERADCFTGTALFSPYEQPLMSTAAIITTPSKSEQLTFNSPIHPIDNATRLVLSPADIEARYPGTTHADTAEITMNLEGDRLHVSFTTPVSDGHGTLGRYMPPLLSSYPADKIVTWDEFKAEVSRLPLDDLVWRGQPAPWSLQTSFHRAGRVDMRRYVFEDIPRLQSALIPHTSTFLDLNSPLLSGAMYNLAQHHGFPTPLLDWTYSPYVAAFFAFRPASPVIVHDRSRVRIFAFNRTNWTQSVDEVTRLPFAMPHVTFLDLPPLENKRALPQQALAMVTNVHHIEAWLTYLEQENNQNYLMSFEISWDDRRRAMRDLRTMGITAGSMFPGLDGTCEELRNRLFD